MLFRFMCASSVMALGVQAGMATAQEAQSGVGIADIVVTAQRKSEAAQNVPIAITALSGERLEQLGVRSLSDVSRVTPGMNTDPAAASPVFGALVSMRGMQTGNTVLRLDPAVGVYLDDVFLPSTLGFALGNILDVDRVEVLKGPQGTLYGRNTTGGAISITSAAPTDEFEGQVGASIGNFGHRSINAVVNLPLGEGLNSRFVGGFTNEDGFQRDLISGDKLGNAKSYVFRGAVRGEAGAVTATVRGDYSRGTSNGSAYQLIGVFPNTSFARQFAAQRRVPLANVPALAALEPGAGVPPNTRDRAYSTRQDDRVKTAGISLDVSLDLGGATLRSITAHRWIRKADIQDLDGTSVDGLLASNDQSLKQFTQEFQLLGNAVDDRLDYIVGAYYYTTSGFDNNDSISLPALNPRNPNRIRNDLSAESLSGFGQATFQFTDQLAVTGGLRYTKEKKGQVSRNTDGAGCQIPVADRINGTCLARFSVEASNLSYLMRASYKPTPDILTYVTYSTGFKGGGINNGTVRPGSFSSYRPEKVRSLEAGVKSDWFDRKLRINLAAYYSKYTDLQRSVTTVDPASGAVFSTIRNAAGSTIKGAEVEITLAPSSRLTINATGSLVDAKYTRYFAEVGRNPTTGAVILSDLSDKTFQNTPKWRGSLSASYLVIDGPTQLMASGDYSYKSANDLDEDAMSSPRNWHVQEGYGLANGRLTLTHSATSTEVALWMRNIFNKRYRTVVIDLADSLGLNVSLTGVPRTFGASVTQRF
ncbi:TonB-dependent receptor [Sphingobium bisphenolivorans]|uniref:TonB-dependent receptor n=1 Tax=Sphingobium bisphenolivorans TaxID=1335760 RepID=UPI0003A4CA00|nr:TonB-dependent receptor [Sphingobium bisphenolivorans]